MSARNVEVVRQCFDAWNRDDLDACLRTWHPHAEFVSEMATELQGTDAVWRGRAGMRQFWEEWRTVWNMRIEVSEIRDLGEKAVVLGHVQARGKASGVELESAVAYECEFDDGLIRRMRALREADRRRLP
jgi:ketosteroid isomerase-like protein